MKVLFLSADTSQVGGIQRYNKTFVAVLRSQGMSVELVELKGSGLVPKLTFVARTFVAGILRRPKVVLCSHVNFASTALLVKRILRIPYILTLFGIEARTPELMSNIHVIKEAIRFTTVSDYTAEKVLETAPELKQKMFFLENSIDGEVFKPGPKKQSLLERYQVKDRKVILTVSRFSAKEKYKGYDKVIEALALMRPSIPDFIYILVGGGDDRPRAEALVKELGLDNNVVFAGVVPEGELVDHYNIADVFVMPSSFDGFGFVFIEALACGVPTIGGNIDGSVHALLEGKTGLLIDPRDPKEIGEAIRKVLCREAPADLLDSNFIREKTLEAYGIRKFEDKVRQLFHGL
jgi:glycosyltransferase involved in cell wall biosynthesis